MKRTATRGKVRVQQAKELATVQLDTGSRRGGREVGSTEMFLMVNIQALEIR